nr:hypothetical protein [Tanacetum cinerariifolium]
MAVEDTPPPSSPPSHTDKIILFSIPNKVPIKLDLKKHNYNSWSSFSLIYLGSLGLKSHVEEDTTSTYPDWCQFDDLIKMWILGSLCDSLQEQVVTTPDNAKSLWDHLKELFHDRKDARALNLDNELFTRDINCTIEFDAFGFSVKDFLTRHILFRCDNSGDLYPVTKPSTLPAAFVSTSSTIWHQLPGHPGDEVLRSLSSHPNLCNAMYYEYNASVKNGTWILVSRPTDANLVLSMWLFKHKFHVEGTLSRYKARLVANGSSQQFGVDFDETFSLLVKPATIRTVLSLAPPGFVDSRYPNHGSQVAYLLIYVGDIILTASSPVLLQQIIDSLHKEFDMTDLGYALQLLERAHMANCNLSRTPADTDSKLGPDGIPVCLYMRDPREPHFAALKRILRYVQGTLELGLLLYASATTSLVGYTDADWAGYPSTRRSTFGYCMFLGDNLLSWSTKRQHTISRSSVEAEYRGVANVPTLFNINAPNIEIDIHFVRDMIKAGHVRVLYILSRFQYVDILTKGLPSVLFEDFRSSLSVRPPSAQTAGAY